MSAVSPFSEASGNDADIGFRPFLQFPASWHEPTLYAQGAKVAIVVISAILIMRADNHGEGGILALLALLLLPDSGARWARCCRSAGRWVIANHKPRIMGGADLCCGAHEPACYQSWIVKPFKKVLMLTKTAPRRVTVRLHAPTKGWFTASLIIALIAVIGALSPVPYVTSYGTWVAILAYVVLAVGNLAST
jgi:hypothetical protein